MNKIKLTLGILLMLTYSEVISLNAVNSLSYEPGDAPITIAPHIIAEPGAAISIPVTVQNFIDIGLLLLQLEYDPSVLVFDSFQNDSSFPELFIDGSFPGIISAGGYSIGPGVTLPDNAVLFTLFFQYIEGNTSLAWVTDGFSCDYGGPFPDYDALNDIPFEEFYIHGSINQLISYPVVAPITTAPHILAEPGTAISIPVTVQNFNDIGVLSLKLEYDPTVLVFNGSQNDSSFPGLTVDGSIPGIISAGGFSTGPGVTLPDNAVLFTLFFQYIEGNTPLAWVTDGFSCDYGGPFPDYDALNDIPFEEFYIHGSINQLISYPVVAPITTAPHILAEPGTSISIPVSVQNFIDIGVLSLKLEYDPSVLVFIGSQNDSSFPGLTVNGSVAGVISAGGFSMGPGLNLPDNAVLFTLFFQYISGDTQLVWVTDGFSCDYGGPSPDFGALNDTPYQEFYINGSVNSLSYEPGDAPITTAPHILAEPGTGISIPVSVQNFNDIGVLSLKLEYDPSVLVFNGSQSDSSFPGLSVDGSIPGIISAGGFSMGPGVTLPDNAVLFTLFFQHIEGYTALAWVTDGYSCEYAGPFPDFETLNDIPYEEFYISGSVSQLGNPHIFCPPDFVVVNQTGLCGAEVDFQAAALGTPTPTITYQINGAPANSPFFFPVGSTSVLAIAQNVNGTATCSFIVIVNDNEPPALLDPADDCSSLDQADQNISLTEAAAFDPIVLEPLVAALYDDNCNEISSQWLNTFPAASNSDEDWLFEYVFAITDVAGNLITCVVTYSGGIQQEVPEVIVLENKTVGDGDVLCYGASLTITLSDFVVLSGGDVTLIAGESIHLLPGVSVASSGRLHACISLVYCENPTPLVSIKDSHREEVSLPGILPGNESAAQSLFRVFPNPANDIASIEITAKPNIQSDVILEMYSMLGERLIYKKISGSNPFLIDLSGTPPGVYIFRVNNGTRTESRKLIRL